MPSAAPDRPPPAAAAATSVNVECRSTSSGACRSVSRSFDRSASGLRLPTRDVGSRHQAEVQGRTRTRDSTPQATAGRDPTPKATAGRDPKPQATAGRDLTPQATAGSDLTPHATTVIRSNGTHYRTKMHFIQESTRSQDAHWGFRVYRVYRVLVGSSLGVPGDGCHEPPAHQDAVRGATGAHRPQDRRRTKTLSEEPSARASGEGDGSRAMMRGMAAAGSSKPTSAR